ncbi:uncharacterized protein [Pyxicephalus adspersus]|uniref:uncharacterized protein n=1 Tax=Pyxicephalus adspersus TaxID=30357 RepID=UPI003B5A8D44
MDRMAEGLPERVGYFPADVFEPSGLQSILKKVPVSSIFPNASRRGRKANAPRKRSHPASVGLNTSQGKDSPGDPTSVQSRVSPILLPHGPANKRTRRTSERSQQRKASMKPKTRTAKDRKEMSEKILNLTMEIISVLAGEECTVMTKSGEPVVSGNYSLAMGGSVSTSVAQTLKQERQNDQKILDLTFQIIQLLTGEGPGGNNDDTSAHVGKEKNKGPHKSVIVERSRPSTSQGARLTEPVIREEAISENPNIYRATGHIDKDDLAAHEGEMITESGTYVQTPFKDQNVKDGSSGEDNMGNSDHADFTTVRIKEESISCEDGNVTNESQFVSIKIKEECVSDNEGNLSYAENFSAPHYKKQCYTSKYRAEDSESGEDDNDSNLYTPADYEQYPPPPMLFPSSGGPVDFLGFDDNSNLDTDVNALIKHAHTKFSFAPIEGGSGSEEDEPVPEPEMQPPPKDDGPKKTAPNTEEPNSGEEGTSEEAAVTSTKKDRTLKTYTCSECQECFVRRSDFANHRRDHRRERLTCPECGKVFANKPSLLNHLTGHTGEKPYSCPVCGKCFTRNSNLIVHQATHIERSPFTALNVGDGLVKQIF